MWCWAATTQGAMQFLQGRRREQCEFASDAFGLECCMTPLADGCNRPYWTDKALKAYGLWRETRLRPLRASEIVTEVRAARPVVAVIQTGRRVIRHAVTIVAVRGPSPWRVTVNDPGGVILRDRDLAEVTSDYRGLGGRWVKTHLLNSWVSLAPPEGIMESTTAVVSASATLSSVRIPMYVAEPEDLVEGRTAESARLAAYEVLPDEAGGYVVEMPASGGQGGQIDGPLATAMLESVPQFERRYGSSVRLLQIQGLFVTVVWMTAERNRKDVVVPIYTLSREVEVGHTYELDEFERLLREPAREHVRDADRERDEERGHDDGNNRDRGPHGR